MSLKLGKSKEVVNQNISEMVRAGHPQKQAVAAALDKARKGKKRRKYRSRHDQMVEAVMMKARKKRKSKVRRTLGKKKMKHPELRGRVEP